MKTVTNNIASQTDTIGKERNFTRIDGKQIRISGGTYGWQCDVSALVNEIISAIKANQDTTIEVPFVSKGTMINIDNNKDWSNYIDIDLTEQKVRYYDENDTLLLESACVSGNPRLNNDTPTGCYAISKKSRNETLQGPIINGKPKWKNKVSYWMPFIDNSIGCHDAAWRGAFGGHIYQYTGSHGCVNMPYVNAKQLYNLIEVGCPVIVHY